MQDCRRAIRRSRSTATLDDGQAKHVLLPTKKEKHAKTSHYCHRDKQFIVTSLGIPTGVRIVHKLRGFCAQGHLGDSYDRGGGALHALRRRATRGC